MEKKAPAVRVAEVEAEKPNTPSLPPLPPSELPAPTWSSEPHPLNESPVVRVLMNIYDAVLCLMPLGLVIKTILCFKAADMQKQFKGSSLWGADLDPLTKFLSDINGQLGTAFTVLFVTIMTTLLRRFALWRAQWGNASVATLEQYQASISLPSTLKTVLSLRAFTFRSFGLVVIWSFYYLGSQATTREYTLSPSDSYERFPVWIPKFNASLRLSRSVPPETLANINSEFIKSMALRYYSSTGQSLSSTNALNGDPYVPTLEEIWTRTVHKQGWYDWTVKPQEYANTAGFEALPQRTTKSVTNSSALGLLVGTYETNTSYFDVRCAGVTWSDSSSLNLTTTQSLVLVPADDDAARKAANYSYPRAFNLRSKGVGGVSSTSCNVSMVSFNLHVQCTNGNCAIDKFRPILNNSSILLPSHNVSEFMYSSFPGPVLTYYDNGTISLPPYDASALVYPPLPPRSFYVHSTPFDDNELFEHFLQNLALSTGLPPDNKTSSQLEFAWTYGRPYEQSLVNLTEAFSKQYYVGNSLNETKGIAVPNGYDPTHILTSAINTYYMLWLKNAVKFDETVYNMATMTGEQAFNTLQGSGNWTVSWMHGAEYLPSYRLVIPWVVIDFISCSILLTAAIIAVILRRQTLAPDIFGYVSSLTRENPNIPLPDGGTSFSGMERARKLKNVKIRIADVSQEGEVGRVGVTVVQNARSPAAQLQKGRTYL